ncbi:hypothetical protein K5V21_13935 [Clostridium sardiniense]|uniref:Helix-turn-helix domain-containing protein n=1 Tax=Clostridium sardiniense TaxID=29369 RepID=A0ABS7L0J5_CLOSR|nr:hypothetical protein [Clostridium sardiniense]MBY0756544.1 hypothetical protein [Clostridium sardiniense]MDQ0460293.1 hypothetical protein [Clostridium sardiniense]
MGKDIEPLWNKKDVAEFLDVSVSAINKWLENGAIKSCPKAPGGVRFNPSYIRSLGEMGFKNNVSSPEIFRLKKKYEKEIRLREEKIVKLEKMIRNFHIESTKAMNTLLDIDAI